MLRGTQRVANNDWVGALADFEQSLRDAPQADRKSPSDVKLRRVQALECCGLAAAANDDFNRAVDLLTEALLLDPQPIRFCLLARVHCCERQWQLAEDRYNDALLLDPQCHMARVGLDQARIKHEPLPLVADV